ncbi:MAG: hypothetical protein HY900_14110, partial [Deltaproteobacteria bacterium]|nr:hypothetical protein [Deltaproteobacteria bacterium]
MERLKGTLWVDLAGLGSLAEEGKEALRRELRDALREGGSAREVRVLLRSPELLCDDPVFVYESFSEAADLARRRRLGLTYLFLTGDRDEDGRRVFLFLVDARAGGGPEPGTVCEFDGELDFWDPDSFRRKCAGTLAARLFIDVGSRQDSALPEPLRPWQADPRTAFAGLSRRWREGFVERLRAHFLPEEGVLRRAARWVAFRWRFGAGRNEGFSRREGSLARRLHATEGGNLFERLRAPDARAGPDPLPHPLSPPFPFLQEIEAVEAVLPDYF